MCISVINYFSVVSSVNISPSWLGYLLTLFMVYYIMQIVYSSLYVKWASLVAQRLKRLPAIWETWVGKIPWRRKWQPTPVFLPGESRGQRSLVGYSPWGHKESDTTE